MKIAIIGADKPDSMEFHLADAFNHAGHQAKVFDIYTSPLFRYRKVKPYVQAIDKFIRSNNDNYDRNRFRKVAKEVNDYCPDIVICLYKDIHPSFVDAVKRPDCKVVHLNPDAMTTLGYQQVFAANYDAWFTKDLYMLPMMKNNMHLNAFSYTEAFNPRFNPKPLIPKQVAEVAVDIDVATYGTLYPYRTRMLNEIIKAGIDIKLYGTIPHRFFNTDVAKHCTGKYIKGEEKASVLYGAKIVLNNLLFAEVQSVNCRFFEANGCGAFQLCDYRPVLNELLPIDPGLVSYRTVDEAIDKIRYYLANPKERLEISQKVYNHFINNYTYDHLVAYLIQTIGRI